MATIIFDFDGTIADSLPLILAIYREMLPGSHEFTAAEMQKLRRMSVQKVAAELGVSLWRVPLLLRRGRRIMHERINELDVIEGMDEVIKALHGHGYELRIVSSNSSDNVVSFLRQHDLLDYFAEVRGMSSIFGKGKALKKVLKKAGLQPAATTYVGDEVRDIVAAKKAGMPMVAVGWGFNDIELLSDMHPGRVVAHPKELLEIFTK